MADTLLIIQARLGSSRLPGKVLMHVCGRPLLWHLVKRLERSQQVSAIVVATTVEKQDDAIERLCREEGISCYRGSEADVLDRFYRAALSHRPGHVVRITADCPLADPAIVDAVVTLCRSEHADYASNTNPPTFPDGLDVEVFTFAALERSWKEAGYSYQREHVTSYITEHPRDFRIVNYVQARDLSAWRLTLDRAEDFAVIKAVYEELYRPGHVFTFAETVALLQERADLRALNAGFARNENYDTNNK